jgi:hypothetical protein
MFQAYPELRAVMIKRSESRDTAVTQWFDRTPGRPTAGCSLGASVELRSWISKDNTSARSRKQGCAADEQHRQIVLVVIVSDHGYGVVVPPLRR